MIRPHQVPQDECAVCELVSDGNDRETIFFATVLLITDSPDDKIACCPMHAGKLATTLALVGQVPR